MKHSVGGHKPPKETTRLAEVNEGMQLGSKRGLEKKKRLLKKFNFHPGDGFAYKTVIM